MTFRLVAALVAAGSVLGAAAAHAQAQFSKPAFDADLLQITPARLSAFEAALKPPSGQSVLVPDQQIRERVAKAKNEQEVQQIMAEVQAQAARANTASRRELYDIAGPYEAAREAISEWDGCVGRARSEAYVKAGAATVATNARVRARVVQEEERALAACRERPKLPASPVPAGWTESGRSFYVMLDRTSMYCGALNGDSELQLERSSEGAVRWNTGEADGFGNPTYYVFVSGELDALKPQCERLQTAIDEAFTRGVP